jgi:hypothetical protein
MPLLKYFGWVGSFLVAALFAANWCFSVSIPRPRPSDDPLNQRINIRIHTDHKWPEQVIFDTTRLMPTPDAKLEAESSSSREILARAERRTLDAFAEIAAIPVWPCFRPPCSADRAAEREASPPEKSVPFQSRSRVAARKGLTSPNPFHKLPGKS